VRLVKGEYRFFEKGTTPYFSTQEFHNDREAAPHIDQHGMQRDRLIKAADFVMDLCLQHDVKTVSDLCCGDGGLLQHLTPFFKDNGIEAWGYDFQPANVSAARARNVDVRFGDAINEDVDMGQLVIMTECLEHFEDPHAMVNKVAEKAHYIVISSPNGETPEAHYELHTWGWSWPAYEKLLTRSGFKITRHEESTIFQVLAGVK
jgi:SAM-dependent methyltransferase